LPINSIGIFNTILIEAITWPNLVLYYYCLFKLVGGGLFFYLGNRLFIAFL